MTTEEYPEEAVKIIEKWAKDCPPAPKKTKLSKALELFPDMQLYDNFPLLCPRFLGFRHCDEFYLKCELCKEKFWLEEIEEDKK